MQEKEVRCYKCGKVFNPQLAKKGTMLVAHHGRVVKCPRCGTEVVVPG